MSWDQFCAALLALALTCLTALANRYVLSPSRRARDDEPIAAVPAPPSAVRGEPAPDDGP